MTAFTPEIVQAVVSHMNGDHVEDNLIIVRAFAEPRAESAVMAGLDDVRGTWTATIDDVESTVHVPWSETLTERAQIRREVVRLYTGGCHALGLTPRDEH